MSVKTSPPRLGRGLAALLGETGASAESTAKAAIRSLPVDLLDPGAFQPRRQIATDALEDLVASIKSHGVLQPILVRRLKNSHDRYEIVAGERRWRAAQAAGLHEVPVLFRDLSDSEALGAALVENLQRQDLNPLEEAEGYQRLISEFAFTQEQLGDVVGKSRSHVANSLRLLTLPLSVRHEVERGRLTAGHARALLGHPLPEDAAREVIARGLNVRQTEALVQRGAGRTTSRRSRNPVDPDTAALARTLAERLGLRVEILPGQRGGSVRIHYDDLDQLDGLITLLAPA